MAEDCLDKIIKQELLHRVKWWVFADDKDRPKIYNEAVAYIKSQCYSCGEQLIYKDYLDARRDEMNNRIMKWRLKQ